MSNTLLQPASFFVMLYGGILVGGLYDGMRLIRRLFRQRFLHALADICFALFATLISACSLLVASGGAIRVYLLIGLLLGAVAEQWSLSYLFFHLFYAIRGRLQ